MKKEILLPLLMAIGLNTSAIANPFTNEVSEPYYTQGPVSLFYVGVAYGMTQVEDDYIYENFLTFYNEHTEVDFNAVMLQIGYNYSPFLATEFRYWGSTSNGDYSLSSGLVPGAGSYNDFDAWGMYIKPMFPIAREVTIYGLLGFSSVVVDGELGWDLVNDSSFSWGLGASFDLAPNISVFVDYVMLFDNTFNDGYYDYDYYNYDSYSPGDTSVDTFNIGLSYKF